jgi:hypothetical protein
MNLSYHNTPFPHIEGSLDDTLYQEVLESWDSIDHKNHLAKTGNRSNVVLDDSELNKKISSIIWRCYENLINPLVYCYPKLTEQEFALQTRIIYSENLPSDELYKIRGWHLDTGDKFLVGLWYFKHPDEPEECGGDLLIMNPKTKEMKVVGYGSNKFIIFPNTVEAWHAVTSRKPSKYPRRYINLLLESRDNTFLHNYKRSGTSVDDEFRGKLVNNFA